MSNKYKICLAASSGGHYEQLLMLLPLLEKYDGFILTEKTSYSSKPKNTIVHYLFQVNRKEWKCWIELFFNCLVSVYIYIKERPNVVICTGVLAMIPMCLIVKLFGGKLIYIESFAKVTSPTETGKLIYKFADRFFIQWEELRNYYPNAEYLGSIY
ncbi:MAG: polysaccharide biosynthesis protein [Erysipelotrichaceae bacterium]|nr:polysaccharide biosynthesis protein [Erysipelotrichaceae bacterium]